MEEKIYFERELEFGKFTLHIYQEFQSDVGGVVWDSAIVVSHFICRNAELWKGKKVLELGAGTGICSIALAACGATVYATDLNGRLSLIEKNISANAEVIEDNGGKVIVRELDWEKPSDFLYDVEDVFLVDALYYLKGVENLIKLFESLHFLQIFCAYEVRDIGEPEVAQKRFFEMLPGFCIIEEVPKDKLDPTYFHPDIKFFKIMNKS